MFNRNQLDRFARPVKRQLNCRSDFQSLILNKSIFFSLFYHDFLPFFIVGIFSFGITFIFPVTVFSFIYFQPFISLFLYRQTCLFYYINKTNVSSRLYIQSVLSHFCATSLTKFYDIYRYVQFIDSKLTGSSRHAFPSASFPITFS